MATYCIASPHKDETWYDYRLWLNLKNSLDALGHKHQAAAVNRIYFLGGRLKHHYPRVGQFDQSANNIALVYCHMEKFHQLNNFNKIFVPTNYVKNYYESKFRQERWKFWKDNTYRTKAPIEVLCPFSSLQPVTAHHPKFKCDVMFMGTPRVRPIVESVINIVEKHQLNMQIIGPSWAVYPGNPAAKKYWTEKSVPYHQLPQLVRGAKICLHDHHQGMNLFKTCSHKYIDMIAAGGFVISDDNDDVKQNYQGLTYQSEAQLEQAILHYLANPEARAKKWQAQHELLKQQTTANAAKRISEHFIDAQ